MSRHDLTDQEWNAIRHYLPAAKKKGRGRPWADHRMIINGVLWILRTGSPWRDLPAEFGNWKTVYNRFRRWVHEDLWSHIFQQLVNRCDQLGKIDRTVWCVDGIAVRAHRCASGRLPQSEESNELAALGRSRGGYSTKLHVLTDHQGNLLSVTATGGQRNESTEFETLLGQLPLGLHRLDKRPQSIAGVKGYSSGAIRNWIAQRKILPVIPTRSSESRDDDFDSTIYRKRNIVERVIGWLKEARRIATRYDKLVASYLAFVQLAAVLRMLNAI